MNDLIEHKPQPVAVAAPAFSMAPRNLEEAWRLADVLADSDMVPKDYKGKPGNVLIAMQWGAEVGLKPLQALQGIAVINGRPSMWGDALLALVRGSGICEYVLEHETADGTAVCRAKRRGEEEQTRTFSNEDANKAGLLGKQGPWATSPKRMKQMRARAFALRDVFTDVLKGMQVIEEVRDFEPSPPAPNRPAVQVVTASAELMAQAGAAADNGMQAYADFWTEIGKDGRKALAGEHNAFKARAVEADKPANGPDPDGMAADVRDEPAVDPETGEIDPFVAAMDRAEGRP
jgi:hypothetical protein